MFGVLAMVDKFVEPPCMIHQSKENCKGFPGIDLEIEVLGFVQKLWSKEVSVSHYREQINVQFPCVSFYGNCWYTHFAARDVQYCLFAMKLTLGQSILVR